MSKNKGLEPGSLIPDFALESADGTVYHSNEWRGSYVLMMFHRGTWCPSCRRQLEQLAKNAGTFEKLGVKLVSVLGQKKEAVAVYLQSHPLPFPVLVDETRDVIKAFDVYHPIGIDAFNIARPSVFLIDPDQKIVYGYVGRHQADLPNQEKLAAEVHEVLSQALEE